MPSPKTVGQFYVETTRQSAKSAASAQDAAARYLDQVMATGKAYLAIVATAQQQSLQNAFQAQDTAIRATQQVLGAVTKANLAIYDEWAKVVADGQATILKMVTATAGLVEGTAKE